MDVKWTYIIMPVGIARFVPGRLEMRRLDNDEWMDLSKDGDMWRAIEQDGYSVAEEAAFEAHEKFKRTYQKG